MPAALLLAAVLGTVPFQREFRDWIGVCDNGRSCTLKAIPDLDSRDAPTGVVITVTRHAGSREFPTVDLWADEKPLDPKRLRLDGRPLPALDWLVDAQRPSLLVLDGPGALTLLRLLRDGHGLTLGTDKDAIGASLNGAAAAFLAMDDAQGRLGGVTVVAAPRPPPLRNAKALARAVRRAKAADLKAEECDARYADGSGDAAEPLTATEAVVILYCQLAAYQGNALAYRVPIAAPAAARKLTMPRLPTQPKDAMEGNGFVDPVYDPETASFISSAKGRGFGDCGASMDWTFDGRAFQPSGLTEQQRCGGEPGEWPDVWRTTSVTRKR